MKARVRARDLVMRFTAYAYVHVSVCGVSGIPYHVLEHVRVVTSVRHDLDDEGLTVLRIAGPGA